MNIATPTASPCFGSFYQPIVKSLRAEIPVMDDPSPPQFSPKETKKRIALAKPTLDLYQDEELKLYKTPRSRLLHLANENFYPTITHGLKGQLGGLTIEVIDKSIIDEIPKRTVAIYPTDWRKRPTIEGIFIDMTFFSKKNQLSYYNPYMVVLTDNGLNNAVIPYCTEAKELYTTVADILGKVEDAIDNSSNDLYEPFIANA